jgi:hypothetical protein
MSDFADIYRRALETVRAKMAEAEKSAPEFEDASVAPYCFVAVPLAVLLAAEDDEAFLRAAYYKILDRLDYGERWSRDLARLGSGEIGREDLVRELISDESIIRRGIRVELV